MLLLNPQGPSDLGQKLHFFTTISGQQSSRQENQYDTSHLCLKVLVKGTTSPGAVGEGTPGTQPRGGARVCPYLSQGVDVDLAPLPALAEVHGGSHQQHIRDTIAVHVQGVDLASVVGADLGETGEDGSNPFLPRALEPWVQEIPDRGQVVLLSLLNTLSTVPQHYLLSLQRLVDGEVAVVVHGEDDDLPRVVEPRRSRDVEPLARGGHDGGDGVTCMLGVVVSRICPPARPPSHSLPGVTSVLPAQP